MSESPNDAAWDAFCDDLKRAGRVLHRATTPQDEQTRAEGLRFLVRLIRIGFENTFEIGDPRHPGLLPMIDAQKVHEGVTADARYHHAFLDGRATHRIRGTRGGAPLMEVSVYTGKAGIHPLSHQLGALTEREIAVDDEGRLEIVLAPEPPAASSGRSWIRTDAQTRYLMVREYAHDWSGVEPARLALSRDDAATRPPLTLDEITGGLASTAEFVARAAELWAGISDYWAGSVVNRFALQQQVDQRTDIGAPIGHQFSCGWLSLEPDEALVARFRPQSVPYWSLGVANYWYETIGFGEPASEINNRGAETESDGSVRVVLGPHAPRGPNWIDTRGHCTGTLIFRWSRSVDPPPAIETEVKTLRELEDER